MRQISISRKELYHLVWSTPIYKLAKQYHISDNGIRKKCIKLDIPLPPRGYWQKIRFNKKIRKPKLSFEKYSQDVVIVFFKEESEIIEKRHSLKSLFMNQIKNDPNITLSVPDRLYNPHAYIKEAKLAFSGDLEESFDKKRNCIW